MYAKFFVLFAILFTGYFFKKFKLIDDGMNQSMNKFMIYFAFPCLVVYNIGNISLNGNLFKQFLICILVSCLVYIIFGVYTVLYAKVRKFPKETSNVAELSMITPNNGFMGFPVSLIFFGQTGLLFMLANSAAMNAYLFSYGIASMKRNNPNREKTSLKSILKSLMKVIVNPNILALIVGIFLCASGINIPSPVNEYISMIGNIASPMAMILIGSTLADCKFSEMIKDRVVIESAISKVILIPLLAIGVVYFMPISSLMKCVTVLAIAFPTAAMVPMVASQEGQDKELATKILFISTVVSMITIPAVIHAVTTIF